MSFGYRVFSTLAIGLLLPFLMLHPKLRLQIKRRLGLYAEPSPWPPRRQAGPRIWFHGASAGDLGALMPVLRALKRRVPDATWILSTMTNSGLAAAEKLATEVDGVTVLPYDLPGCTRRAVRVLKPDLLVLEYAEIWPNLIDAVHAEGAAIALTNGRFSEALLGRYQRFFSIFGNPLAVVDLLLMREDVEADRARALGAPRDRVLSTGNTKFDNLKKSPEKQLIDDLARALQAEADTPIFVAGSTHEGEEQHLLAAFREMRAVSPKLKLVIAPRYTERGSKVLALAKTAGYAGMLRTEPSATAPDVLVLNTIGELQAAYALATLVFVGGSFVPRGGQNILEPAALGKPVLFGPEMANFRDSVEVLMGRGGIQVASPDRLGALSVDLLMRPDEIARLGEMARAAVVKVSGASERNAEALERLLIEKRRLAS
ncbi:MAG: glycosyltransferase N-terminal domain-containing protein [Myxococcota bacterium]